MSGVHRFLSRREKKSPRPQQAAEKKVQQQQQQHSSTKTERKPDHYANVFSTTLDPKRKTDKDEDKKIKAILGRLHHYGITTMDESNVHYALQSNAAKREPAGGESEAAFRLLMMFQETCDGVVLPYKPSTKLLGAVNREGVTCFLDALMFAMFARLDSFEALLYDSYDDKKRKQLAGLLRLWVNMLRSGRLITTDITRQLQNALAECGWEEASKLRQQDPSEAFGFITSQLELPLLTLKMDLYHTGKEDPQDDHKFINERLLEVALLDRAPDGREVITLEDCLEHYFNNRIEVKRHMELQRRNTLKSQSSGGADTTEPSEKESATHVEVAEVAETPVDGSLNIPGSSGSPVSPKTTAEKLRPTGRGRTASIFSQRKVSLTGIDPEKLTKEDEDALRDPKGRSLSTKTEVLMPAWQFFKLLPWYTANAPTSDAQVAAHFSRKRPVLGICLKRYSYTNSGEARRLNTYIDIPLEITVPNFVSDDSMEDNAPLGGNFRLLLQSVVCHRGVSVDSGHYISLVRGKATNAQPQQDRRGSGTDSDEESDPWMRFDDLARERVSFVDIHQALKDETPYLLFYQVQPIGEDSESHLTLPSYTEATSRSQSDAFPADKPTPSEQSEPDLTLVATASDTIVASPPTTEATDFGTPSNRTSFDASTLLSTDHSQPRGRLSISAESDATNTVRNSISWDSGSATTAQTATNSVPSTPSEEKPNSFLAVASKLSGSRRTSRAPKATSTATSRNPSMGPGADNSGNGNRFSLNMSKLTARMSRGQSGTNLNQNLNLAGETAGAGEQLPPNPKVDDLGLKITPSAAVAAELAGQKDVVEEEKTPAVVAAPLERNDSMQNGLPVAKKAEPAVKTGKGKKKEKGHNHHGHSKHGVGGQDERECAVM